MGQSVKQGRDISLDAVKGFLILCIILEHNHLLVADYDWIRAFCDAFAAGAFLVLTFIRPIKFQTLSAFTDKYLAYWVPFGIFLLGTSVLNYLLYSDLGLLGSVLVFLKAFFIASPEAIKNASGFMYFWFLPCLSFLFILRLLLSKSTKVAFVLSIAAFLSIGLIEEETLYQTPYSLHVIAFIYVLGLIYGKLHGFLINGPIYVRLATIVAFLGFSLASSLVGWELFLASGKIPSLLEPNLLLFYGLFLLIAIPGLYNLITYIPVFIVKIFSYIGVKSMLFYLIHQLVFVAITKVTPIVSDSLLSYFVTIALTAIVVAGLSLFPRLERKIFPTKVTDLVRSV